MKRNPPLTREQIAARLTIDPATGTARWLDPSKHHARLVGSEAGSVRTGHSGKSYWHIKLDGIPYKRSHLVYAYVTGVWPDQQIDHKNGESLDDRFDNLRLATQMQNAWNHKRRAKKSPLPMGVRVLPNSSGFQARITHNKKLIHLGVFPTPEAAHAAYMAKRRSLFGEFA